MIVLKILSVDTASNVCGVSILENNNLICNLDNYKDTLHYSEDINSQILRWMAAGKYELTKENYQEYCDQVEAFLTKYDYEQLFQ